MSSTTKSVPDLSKAEDISDYVLSHADLGFSSASEAESDVESDGAGGGEGRSIVLPADYGRGNRKSEKRAIRLIELGPRLELGLVKVEDGLNKGEVLFHEFFHKTPKEIAETARKQSAKKRLAEERKREQEANVLAKRAQKVDRSDVEKDDDFDVEDAAMEQDLDPVDQLDVLDEILKQEGGSDGSDNEEAEDEPRKRPRRLDGRKTSHVSGGKKPKMVIRGRLGGGVR